MSLRHVGKNVDLGLLRFPYCTDTKIPEWHQVTSRQDYPFLPLHSHLGLEEKEIFIDCVTTWLEAQC